MREINQESTFSHFWDMHSGGRQKLDWPHIYIEAPEDEAKSVFYARFGRNPERVTCTCCGEDYSINSGTFTEVTAYHRNLRYIDEREPSDPRRRYLNERAIEIDEPIPEGYVLVKTYRPGKQISQQDYINSGNIKVIFADEIEEHERHTDVPAEGYMWM